MPHTPTDMTKWWTGSSCKLCQKLVISPFQSEISDVPAGCHMGDKGIYRGWRHHSIHLRQEDDLYIRGAQEWPFLPFLVN